MELQYYGANCVRLTSKKAAVIVDDNLAALGLKTVTKAGDICLNTNGSIPRHNEAVFTANTPGEYEIQGFIIHGVPARGHMDEEGKLSSTIYTVESEDVRVAIVGHIFPDLSEDQLEQIGMIDIAVIPIGGNGYTLDGVGALQIIKKIEPKIVIPTHYADKQIKYDVPQAELTDALKGLAMEPSEKTGKLKLKANELTDSTRLIILERQ